MTLGQGKANDAFDGGPFALSDLTKSHPVIQAALFFSVGSILNPNAEPKPKPNSNPTPKPKPNLNPNLNPTLGCLGWRRCAL